MPLLPYVELFSFGQDFALVIPRPSFNQAATTLYGGASENDLVRLYEAQKLCVVRIQLVGNLCSQISFE